ncbi:FixH family protein [Vibrio coralliirubri]|uniref:FixH family protein n=1 Tax=Vibrio coralliirubri TaxID=1516159 RepID=UPI002FE3D7B7
MTSIFRPKSISLIVLLSVISHNSFAIDAFAKVKKERPMHLDTSTQLSSGGLTIGYIPLMSHSNVMSEEIKHDVPLNKIHNWTLMLTRRDGSPVTNAEIETIAEMPEHLHGMTTTPVITETMVEGEYLIEGMNFHMPGWWVVSFDVSGYGSRALVRFHLAVGEDGENASVEQMDHSKHGDHSNMEMKDHEGH